MSSDDSIVYIAGLLISQEYGLLVNKTSEESHECVESQLKFKFENQLFIKSNI